MPAGPERPYNKNRHLLITCREFVAGIRDFAESEGVRYDVLHSHYWLSGLAASDLRAAWDAPIVHMFHTLARAEEPGRADVRPSWNRSCASIAKARSCALPIG